MLSLLDGPTGCDPAFCVVWSGLGFAFLHMYLALWPSRVGVVFLGWLVKVALVMVLSIFFLPVLLRLASGGILWLWLGLGLVGLCLVTGFSIFKAAILDAWRIKVAADLCGREGFRGGPLLDVHGSLQLLSSSHVRERDKELLRSVMVGGVWNGFLLFGVRRASLFHVGFVVLRMVMVICFGIVLFLLL